MLLSRKRGRRKNKSVFICFSFVRRRRITYTELTLLYGVFCLRILEFKEGLPRTEAAMRRVGHWRRTPGRSRAAKAPHSSIPKILRIKTYPFGMIKPESVIRIFDVKFMNIRGYYMDIICKKENQSLSFLTRMSI